MGMDTIICMRRGAICGYAVCGVWHRVCAHSMSQRRLQYVGIAAHGVGALYMSQHTHERMRTNIYCVTAHASISAYISQHMHGAAHTRTNAHEH